MVAASASNAEAHLILLFERSLLLNLSPTSCTAAKWVDFQDHPFPLLSILFPTSNPASECLLKAFTALISIAVISIPTMNVKSTSSHSLLSSKYPEKVTAFRRLEASANQMSNTISKGVPGTLLSLILSGLDIHQLTQQFATLRQI
ncbi:hypothetical protein FEM48_Zijuj12G0210700 [Ziziphus jujuba var. spinosa]|uniref:Uncharacterized protein n=1 Tax=Ziziphus jujuba var. spinosa TaxID=714518 RepID=A0A978UFJ3_ZIZJJ|nr:hypothetical protein FEM48_Zijuj12G0210700 [Ziziphus jujuba var. spinosa]